MKQRLQQIGIASISCVLLVMLCWASAANTQSNTKLTVRTPDQLPKAGEAFSVTVDLTENPGVAAVQFTLGYDTSMLECTDVEFGAILESVMNAANPNASGGAKIAAISTKGITKDGTLAVFTFRAKSDLTALSFVLDDVVLSDLQGKDVLFAVVQGTQGTAPNPPAEEKPPVQPGDNPGQGTVTPPEEKPPVSFPDTAGHWSESFVGRAVDLGLFKGYQDGTFRPDVNVTRGQFVTVLWRLAGSPVPPMQTPFTDIASQNAEFQNAIAWAYGNGYINGIGENLFAPNDVLTRQAAMKILFFYSGGQSGTELMFTQIYDQHYVDSASIASWGKAPMYWGVFHEIISGTSETTLSPNGTATRGQLAKIMVNYLDKVAK